MSDGMTDANAVGELGAAVERQATRLAQAMWEARAGHRGLTVDELEAANEVLGLYGLALTPSKDYVTKLERAARLLRW